MKTLNFTLFLALSILTLPQGSFAQDKVNGPDIYQIAQNPKMRIAFDNDGGIAGTGVCWWHSRLQRSFWYLAKFDAKGAKPSQGDVSNIVSTLMDESAVVTIPGYENVYDFTKDNQATIQSMLNAWERKDTISHPGKWIAGIFKKSSLAPNVMKGRMDQIYSAFQEAKQNNKIIFMRLKATGGEGIHASLLYDMQPLEDGGYHIQAVDSNYAGEIISYEYKMGDVNLDPLQGTVKRRSVLSAAGFVITANTESNSTDYGSFFSWTPYLDSDDVDMDKIENALK